MARRPKCGECGHAVGYKADCASLSQWMCSCECHKTMWTGKSKRKSRSVPKKKWFKDHPHGVQLHVGEFRGKPLWHSDDGGKTWWSGYVFSHDAKVTTGELENMALSIIRTIPTK